MQRSLRLTCLALVIVPSVASAREAGVAEAVAPAASRGEPAPSALVLAGTGGGGAGSVGVAARYSFDLEYRVSEHVGVGAVFGGAGQLSGLFGGTRLGYHFVAPAITVHGDPGYSHAFASVAAGYMQGTWTQLGDLSLLCLHEAECGEPPVRTEVEGMAGTLAAGYVFGDARLRPGLVAMLDALVPTSDRGVGKAAVSVTLNVTLELGLF